MKLLNSWIGSVFTSALALMPALFWASDIWASEGGEGGHAEGPHGVPSYVWFHLINFTILAYFLFTKLRRPLRDHLIKRHDTIKDALERSEILRRQAEARAEDLAKKLDGLNAELVTMKVQAQADAQREAERLLASTEANVARMRSDADKLLQEEVSRAASRMRQEVTDLALELATRMLRERITAEDQGRLAGQYLDQLGQSKEIH